ncbi:MAG: hypothetical protein US58_C0001G0029 [Candidatus Magasanikbacteria bacterium GW2011_GWA2_37_8]|uniref:Uncharacterized protein n=1 Tax=Candidatus Magasanikbacteria bacterium GW2011_GWA2_37_8 TaxID=1619036 RepID=A0A0G0HRW1_9BACT|nr:MAG: hypothetical protein US58_C0001G0029 [Candidatus Magasanikbacteria bacterium GW2011_GWA2_37_8]
MGGNNPQNLTADEAKANRLNLLLDEIEKEIADLTRDTQTLNAEVLAEIDKKKKEKIINFINKLPNQI